MCLRKLLSASITIALHFMYGVCVIAQQPVRVASQRFADIPALIIEPSLDDLRRQTGHFVGYYIRTSLNPGNSGYWKRFNHCNVWQLKIRLRDAPAVALVLSDVRLKSDEKLVIYNLQGLKYLFSQRDIPASGILAVPFVQGEEVVLEFQVRDKTESGTFNIEKIVRAYRDIDDTKSDARIAAKDCYTCIAGDSIDLARRSVVKIITFQEGGPVFCTGTLVNNSSNDKSPYVLTAQHCITNAADANRSIFIFDYDDRCEKLQAHDFRQLYGATLLLSSFDDDITLVKLDQSPPISFRPYFAGWNLSGETPHTASSIHHPFGGPKKISTSLSGIVPGNYDDARGTDHGFWRVTKWNTGITETGSSGAPLFNDRTEIIGTLTGGRATCEYPYDDYFKNLSATSVRSELLEWLDPASLQEKSLPGLDPLDATHLSCHPITNVAADESIGLEVYTGGEGYYSGHNSEGITSYAEKFFFPDSATISSISFSVGSGNQSGGVVFAIHPPDPDGLPGEPVYEKVVPAQVFFGRGSASIDALVKVKGAFFVSYTLSDYTEEAFAINQVMWSNGTRGNTAYVRLESAWVPMTSISPHGESTSFDIGVDLCVPSSIPVPDENTISVFPNPASSHTVVQNSDDSVFTLQLFDLQGQRQNVLVQAVDNNVIVDLSAISAGTYILKVVTPKKVFVRRVVKTE